MVKTQMWVILHKYDTYCLLKRNVMLKLEMYLISSFYPNNCIEHNRSSTISIIFPKSACL